QCAPCLSGLIIGAPDRAILGSIASNFFSQQNPASAQKSSPFPAMCVRCWRKQKSLCTFGASVMATATSLLITAASCWPSMAAESPAQSDCLTPTERQATTMPVNYQVMERDGDMVWVKPPAEVATYYPSLMK